MTRGTQRLLIEILAILALINAVAAIQNTQALTISDIPAVSYPPVLRIGAALFWALLFVRLIVGLRRRPQHTARYLAPLLSAYGAWGIGWLIVFARTDYDRGRIGFQAVLTVTLLLPIWLLCRPRPE